MMTDDTQLESVTTLRQRMACDRDDDRSVGPCPSKLGEIVEPPNFRKRTGRLKAEEWVSDCTQVEGPR
jgi:hypothetical protein